MDSDGQLELYDRLAARLKEAHTRVRTLQVPEGVRVALARKLLVVTAASKHDLADAERRLNRLMRDIDEGRFPAERGAQPAEEPSGGPAEERGDEGPQGPEKSS
jgi:cell division protein YceG involved in septum cleavage